MHCRMKATYFLASLMVLTLPCVAQGNPWNGSWQMDKSTLKYDGPTVTITTNADGYTVDRGDKKPHKIVCDGKPNPPYEGGITTCTKTSTGYLLTNTFKDKTKVEAKIEISSDGGTMKRTATISPADDKPFTMVTMSKKVPGGSGKSTMWKETTFDESQESGVLTIMVKGNSVDFKESDSDKPVTCKLDGTPVKITGSRTMAIKSVGTHTLKVTYTQDGKAWRENTFVLSPDGKSVKETDVTPPPKSTLSVVFHKA
jgi:hypothetical protein